MPSRLCEERPEGRPRAGQQALHDLPLGHGPAGGIDAHAPLVDAELVSVAAGNALNERRLAVGHRVDQEMVEVVIEDIHRRMLVAAHVHVAPDVEQRLGRMKRHGLHAVPAALLE